MIEERNTLDANAAVRKFLWQAESLGYDVPLTMTVGETIYYYHTDANKNVMMLTDAQSNVVESNEYSPFGKLIPTTGNIDNPFKFSSEYYDTETELVYYNYRYYNPTLGRWISRDPIEEQGGFNLYGMIGNNPLDGWNELGLGLHEWWWCCFKDLFTSSKEAKDGLDKINSAKETKDNLETISDPNAAPGDKARAAGTEIGKAAEEANRKRDAENATRAGEKSGATLDDISASENMIDFLINDTRPYKSNEKRKEPTR